MKRLRGWTVQSLRNRGCVAVAVAVATGGLVAACGSASSSSGGTAQANASTGKVPSTVTVAFAQQPAHLDSNAAFLPEEIAAIHLSGGNLFELRGSGKLSPGLAQSYKASANGLTATAVLRPHLKFADGSPLTAQDVAATITRAINNKTNVSAGSFAPIKTIAAKGQSTVAFTFRRPYPSFPTISAEPQFTIYPAKDLDPSAGTAKAGFFTQPVSAGPYEIAGKYDGGPDITLVRNPNYWGPKAQISQLKLVTIADSNARINALRSGQVQMAEGIPPNLISTVKSDGLSVVAQTGYGFYNIVFNVTKAPFTNVNVRHAISDALDRKELTQVAFDGSVPPLVGYWPQTMHGYNASASTGAAASANLDEAKRLIAASPCAGGKCTVTLTYNAQVVPFAAQITPIIQSELQAIGLHTKLLSVDFATITRDSVNGSFEMVLQSVADYANVPDGLPIYTVLQSGGNNAEFSGYKSAAMNALYATATSTTGASRLKAEQQMDALFLDDMPFAQLAPYVDVWATKLPTSAVFLDHGLLLQVKRAGS
jgi:peptide/nickel transport system substrate-binding protein